MVKILKDVVKNSIKKKENVSSNYCHCLHPLYHLLSNNLFQTFFHHLNKSSLWVS